MPTAVVKSLFRFSAFQTKLILVCCTLKKKKKKTLDSLAKLRLFQLSERLTPEVTFSLLGENEARKHVDVLVLAYIEIQMKE